MRRPLREFHNDCSGPLWQPAMKSAAGTGGGGERRRELQRPPVTIITLGIIGCTGKQWLVILSSSRWESVQPTAANTSHGKSTTATTVPLTTTTTTNNNTTTTTITTYPEAQQRFTHYTSAPSSVTLTASHPHTLTPSTPMTATSSLQPSHNHSILPHYRLRPSPLEEENEERR
ncbi:hypothetical protein E2C01_021829 [Portunus trituberculatus]|uniref:Uncharacterized protein n=1 Tax=Portunus trituberculatus TaxID=210409 RepID=A0A5B7E3N0_PORTR|nr:hypothetical protein [Portunus trituberculatus]